MSSRTVIPGSPSSIVLRGALPSDQGYVASTWIRATNENAYAVDAALDRRTARVVVACPSDNRDRIEGWACYERIPRATIVHMVYARRAQHRDEILDRLIEFAIDGRKLPVVTTAAKQLDWEVKWKPTRMTLQELLRP